jgi:hypothetical protein
VGLLEEAARIMEEGLALYEGAHERDDGELADVLADVSVVYSKQTRYDETVSRPLVPHSTPSASTPQYPVR